MESCVLFGSLTSPYVRIVRTLADERGLTDQIELVVVDPFSDDPRLLQHSPVGKIPVLVTGQGALADSRVICVWLDGQGTKPPMTGDILDQTRAATAQAMLDATVGIVLEGRRPAPLQSEAAVERQLQRLRRILDVVRPSEQPVPTLGDISLGCALGYLDLRIPDRLDWRGEFPALADWFADFSQRPSMQLSMYPVPR